MSEVMNVIFADLKKNAIVQTSLKIIIITNIFRKKNFVNLWPKNNPKFYGERMQNRMIIEIYYLTKFKIMIFPKAL